MTKDDNIKRLVFFNGNDWIAAENVTELKKLKELYELDDPIEEWEALPSALVLDVNFYQDDYQFGLIKGKMPKNHTIADNAGYVKVSATCEEWAAIGRGLICSLDW